MQPSYITVMNVFTQQTRYTVPLFQRPYVWNREDQWEPLWEDVRAAAERVLNADGKPVAAHFLGTVVLEQTLNPTFSLPRREVIDGQQRLTTLQLVLKAAEHALDALRPVVAGDDSAAKAVDIASRQIEPLTSNPAYSEEEERYKVWPTNEDRAAFCDVMDSKAPDGPANTTSRMAQAYAFFRKAFFDWLGLDRQGDRAKALASALKDYLRLIVLDLDVNDEPQAIFETLNAHGTPLLPADLIKNWLLWEGSRQGLETEALYTTYWQPFDRGTEYWRAIVGTGHAARARVDTFLQNWLTRNVREVISAKHLYSRFLDYVDHGIKRGEDGKISVPQLMQDIDADAKRFSEIDGPSGNTRFDTFLRRLKVLDVVVFHPLLLTIMGRMGSTKDDRNMCAQILESYLVRRTVCGMQTRGYGSLALSLLDKVAKLPADSPAAPALLYALSAAPDGPDRWPSDDAFRTDWLNKKFYGNLRRNRVLMILRAIEEYYQAQAFKSEPVLSFNFDKLEIEHIMPQAWDAHWPLTDPLVTREDRNWKLQGIGNLTLVSAALNKSLSHGPWIAAEGQPSKQSGLRDHTKLELNARLLKDHPNEWNEGAISTRAGVLFNAATEIWPSALDMAATIEATQQSASAQ